MVATWNPAAVSGYYISQTGYYSDGPTAGTWYAPFGDLGTSDRAAVDPDQFAALCAGLDRGGQALASPAALRPDRVPAFDVTLSAPRSVSLVWALAPGETKKRIEQAQEAAVRATLDMLAVEATWGRRGKGGTVIEAVPLTAACFQHGESRPAQHADGRVFADPNLHTHCVIMNLATRPDGTVGALHSKILRDHKMTAGAVYHAALASELQKLGFAVDRIGRNGVFEIAGVADEAIQYFSARRQEIEAELARHGADSPSAPSLAAAITRETRRSKTASDMSTAQSAWIDAAQAIGLDVAGFVDTLRTTLIDRDLHAAELALQQKLDELPELLTQTQSVIERRELLRVVAACLVGTGLPAERAATEVDRLLRRKAFLEIAQDALGRPLYSTPEMVAVERQVVESAQALAQDAKHELQESWVTAICRTKGLSREQTEAAVAATRASGIAIIEGAPGSGKTTTLAPIVGAYQEAGYRVIGAASAWRIAHALRDDLRIEARANASLLERLRLGHETLDAKTVLIVDEAGLVGSREMREILQAIANAGTKLILCGDRRQLQAIGAGSGLSLVAHTVEATRVDTIVRQRETWAREAVRSFGEGKAGEALKAFDDRRLLVEADGPRAAVTALVDRWLGDVTARPQDSTLLIAKTNAQVGELAREVRGRLKASGVLNGIEVAFAAATPSGHASNIALMAGDKIRFLARNDALGVINGSVGVVTRVSRPLDPQHPGQRAIRVEARVNGRQISFDPRDLADAKGRAQIGWAYASTIYSAQGLTVDRAYVAVDGSFDRHDIYVAASRARDRTLLVVDAKTIDRQLSAADAPGAKLDKRSDPAMRQAWLAARLARSSSKVSTVDAIAVRRALATNAVSTRQVEPHHAL